jgi:hypothetical protein
MSVLYQQTSRPLPLVRPYAHKHGVRILGNSSNDQGNPGSPEDNCKYSVSFRDIDHNYKNTTVYALCWQIGIMVTL